MSADEKPHIQALERAQGWLKLPNGKALSCFQHDYKWHGTTTLYAAPEVATGLVKGDHYKRRRRMEFLDFMNGIVAEHPDREIHVILDNLNTHKRTGAGVPTAHWKNDNLGVRQARDYGEEGSRAVFVVVTGDHPGG